MEMLKENSMLTRTMNDMHRIRVMGLLAVLGAAALVLAPRGVSGYEPPEREGQPAADEVLDLDAETPHVVSDARIHAAIETQFAKSDELSALEIDTDVRDGNVFLRGTVASEAQRELASEFATSPVGVRAVVNELEVQDDHSDDRDSHNEEKE
ncbi:MAG: BON domain-containing protein [Gammaproteobacteria bacterium]